jgi:hypothetical protein
MYCQMKTGITLLRLLTTLTIPVLVEYIHH